MGRPFLKKLKRFALIVTATLTVILLAAIIFSRSLYGITLRYLANQPGNTENVEMLFAYAPAHWSLEVVASSLQRNADPNAKYKLLHGAQKLDVKHLEELRPELLNALQSKSFKVRSAALDMFLHHPVLITPAVNAQIRKMATDKSEDRIIRIAARLFLMKDDQGTGATSGGP
jgi:hypothetical protein